MCDPFVQTQPGEIHLFLSGAHNRFFIAKVVAMAALVRKSGRRHLNFAKTPPTHFRQGRSMFNIICRNLFKYAHTAIFFAVAYLRFCNITSLYKPLISFSLLN